MHTKRFPALPLEAWRATRATVQGYCQVLGAVRGVLGPRLKHSQHRSLRVTATGLTTTPMPYKDLTVEMALDLTRHQLVATTSTGERWKGALRGQSLTVFFVEAVAALRALGVTVEVGATPFQTAAAAEAGTYDPAAVERFWLALSQVEAVLRRFKGELRTETSDVQLWPHGFDLAMLWITGRLVPGQDPNVPRDADEQMNFGFSTGDAGIPEPYFYATAYPLPPELPKMALPEGVAWHSAGWQGAVMRYGTLAGQEDAEERLLGYWRAVQREGARWMGRRDEAGG
jgi:hypothetical protein